MPRKNWTDAEVAWLNCNLGRDNVSLSKIMGRTKPSVESMKRNIRNGRDVSRLLIEVIMYHNLQRGAAFLDWMEHNEKYTQVYLIQVGLPEADVYTEPSEPVT